MLASFELPEGLVEINSATIRKETIVETVNVVVQESDLSYVSPELPLSLAKIPSPPPLLYHGYIISSLHSCAQLFLSSRIVIFCLFLFTSLNLPYSRKIFIFLYGNLGSRYFPMAINHFPVDSKPFTLRPVMWKTHCFMTNIYNSRVNLRYNLKLFVVLMKEDKYLLVPVISSGA